MDVWVNFTNATKWQAEGIFKCFFPTRTAKEKAERQQKIVSSLGWCVFVAGVASLGFGALKLVRHSRFMN